MNLLETAHRDLFHTHVQTVIMGAITGGDPEEAEEHVVQSLWLLHTWDADMIARQHRPTSLNYRYLPLNSKK